MPEINSNKLELKFFKKKILNEKKKEATKLATVSEKSAKLKNPVKSPQNRVKIAAPYAEELVISSPSERNWRGIFIALLVIVAVLGLIVFSIVLVSPPEECPRTKGLKPTLEDIFLKLPPPARFNGTWVSDSEFIFKDSYGGISLYDAENLTTSIIMTNITIRQYEVFDFKVSNDLKFILLISDVIKIYQYTTLAKYHTYEISSRIRKPLSPKELDDTAPYLQYATWSNDGTAIAFVYENDIYYKPKVEKDLVCRITNTGRPSVVFNGVPDWLYENEILKTSHTLWFSSDGLYLLYISFNDIDVGEYKYSWYNSRNYDSLYPQIRSFRYPRLSTSYGGTFSALSHHQHHIVSWDIRLGALCYFIIQHSKETNPVVEWECSSIKLHVETANPEAKVWIVNLTMPKYLFPFELKPTNSVEPGSYVTSASFHGEHDVGVIWLNRPQNLFVIATCRNKDGYNCSNMHVEKEHIGWTEPVFHPVFNQNGTKVLVRLPVKDGENGHNMHACEIYKGKVRPLTHGAFELTRILGWDEENSFIYALGTIENQPGQRHLLKIIDKDSYPEWTCMTCNLLDYTNITTHNATNITYDALNETTFANDSLMLNYRCYYNNVIFSKNLNYFIQECLGPDIPIVVLVKTLTNTRKVVLDANRKLRRKVRKLSAPQEKTISVEIEFGYKAQVKLYLPQILREYEDVTYPLILLVDASPSSQTVSSKWELSWPWYLASTRNYIVAKIDARGSGYQGVKMRREIQRRIGLIEIQDQLAVLTYLRDTFKFIDRLKICTIGKGYGGYVSSMMLLQDFHQLINCSVSISPITNWKYYNSFYAEKYLGLPSKHPLEYENADLTTKAANLNEKRFLLIYGTADARITSQHAAMLAKALVQEDVLFEQMVYPDQSFDFDSKALLHMYKEIDRFFNESFGPIIDEWIDESGFFI